MSEQYVIEVADDGDFVYFEVEDDFNTRVTIDADTLLTVVLADSLTTKGCVAVAVALIGLSQFILLEFHSTVSARSVYERLKSYMTTGESLEES